MVLLMIASAGISYALMPKPKGNIQKAQTLETPTIDAGRSVPVVFGRVRVKSPNILYMGGRFTREIKRDV
jgi:hypothetical protein